MYQRVIVVGNLGADPEMRFTPSGVPVTNFSVATNRRWTNDAGEQQEETTWFRVVAWRRLAETCNQYLSKGRAVLVDGRIQTRSWEDAEGQTQYSWELVANQVKFLGGRGEAAEPPYEAEEVPEEEIPF